MDESHRAADGTPAAVQAGLYRFRPGERLRNEHVVSMAWIWTLRGSGQIRSAGRAFSIGPRQLLKLPWRHEVQYLADRQDPFHVAAVHVLPWHATGVPIIRRAAHGYDDELDTDPVRRSADTGERQEPSLHFYADSAIQLGTFAVSLLDSGVASDDELRAVGSLVMAESVRLGDGDQEGGIPTNLRRMQDFVRMHMEDRLTVALVSGAGECSTATAQRLFERHLGMSVQNWIRAVRMDMAATLFDTTSMRVNEVGRKVGFKDPLYFSRVFTKTYGIPPSSFVRRQLRP